MDGRIQLKTLGGPYSRKMIAISIIAKRDIRERRKLEFRLMFGWTAVHTHKANVARQLHNISDVPLVSGPDVQPCLEESSIMFLSMKYDLEFREDYRRDCSRH